MKENVQDAAELNILLEYDSAEDFSDIDRQVNFFMTLSK